MTDQQRWEIVKKRREKHLPHHAPPKDKRIHGFIILTAACFEHHAFMQDLMRRVQLEEALSDLIGNLEGILHAWTVLPNHYHYLVEFPVAVDLRPRVGRVHGRLSRIWNMEDNTPGRKIWYSSFERSVRSRRHFYTSLNYIHHNAVKHGYCLKWQDWKTSSAARFIEEIGYEKALDIWRAFPIKSFGKSIEG